MRCWADIQWHKLHTKSSENQSVDSEVETGKHKQRGDLISLFYSTLNLEYIYSLVDNCVAPQPRVDN
jgi:hypothetical protein